MDIDIKKTYGYLVSHTFPGLLFGIQIMLAFKLFTTFDGFELLYRIDVKAVNLIAIIILFYVISTILGIIVDGIHHFVLRRQEEKYSIIDIYKYIKNNNQITMFNMIDEDYWYYYEAYANIGIAMIPGIILLPYFLYIIKFNYIFSVIIFICYTIIIFILFSEAISTLGTIKKITDAMVLNFKSDVADGK